MCNLFDTLCKAAERIADASSKSRQLKLDDVYISGILRRKTNTNLFHARTVYAPNTAFDAPLLKKLEDSKAPIAQKPEQKVFVEE